MDIHLRQIRLIEIEAALKTIRSDGDNDPPGSRLVAHLSVVACDAAETPLGYALDFADPDGRHHLIIAAAEAHAARAELAARLVDCALRKTAAAGLATTRVDIRGEPDNAATWTAADWLSRLAATSPSPAPAPG